jgi:hypothetical protein
MPAGRQLPAVTKNRNYPQPVKHLKPAALTSDPVLAANNGRAVAQVIADYQRTA